MTVDDLLNNVNLNKMDANNRSIEEENSVSGQNDPAVKDNGATGSVTASDSTPLSVEKAESDAEEVMKVTERAIELLRTVYDPEIPVNVYDLGLIYKIDYNPEDKTLHVEMTLTAPGCPAADFIMEDVRQKLMSVEGPAKVDLRLVFEPVWTQDMMSEEAKLELGFM